MTAFRYNGHSYLLSHAGTWQEAQSEALSLGGNLVTINDQAEQNWLVTTFGTAAHLWIGYTDQETEGVFQWISGENSTYTNWISDEPNNAGNEDYTHLWAGRNGGWNDLPNSWGAPVQGIIELINNNFMPANTLDQIITSSGGIYSMFADLAKAAYTLAADETPNVHGVNFEKANTTEAWNNVNGNWNALSAAALGIATTGTVQPGGVIGQVEGQVNWHMDDNGIFHCGNAAAYVGQCGDALAISFRGTNDNDDGMLPWTPDQTNWLDMDEHYSLFQPLIQAFDQYAANNGINKVMVTGHSLGGAMALGYMENHADTGGRTYQAVTFAAPGFNTSTDPALDARITQFEVSGDPVPDAKDSFRDMPGYNIFFDVQGLPYGDISTDYHSMDLYRAIAESLDHHGVVFELDSGDLGQPKSGLANIGSAAWNYFQGDSVDLSSSVVNFAIDSAYYLANIRYKEVKLAANEIAGLGGYVGPDHPVSPNYQIGIGANVLSADEADLYVDNTVDQILIGGEGGDILRLGDLGAAYGGEGNDVYEVVRNSDARYELYDLCGDRDTLNIIDNFSVISLDAFNDLNFEISGSDLLIRLDIQGLINDDSEGTICIHNEGNLANRIESLNLWGGEPSTDNQIGGTISLQSIWEALGTYSTGWQRLSLSSESGMYGLLALGFSGQTEAEDVLAADNTPTFVAGNTLGGTIDFTEGGAAAVLDSNVIISDADLAALNSGAGNYANSTLTLVRNGGANAGDVFSSTAFFSSHVVVSGTTIGAFTQANGALTITFNANATQTLVNSALQHLAYSNSADNPPASVQIDWTFSDGNTGAQGSGGALSAVGSTTVNITAVNDEPTFTAFNSAVASGNEDSQITVSFAGLQSQGNEADDGTVTAFVIKAVNGGSLKIGTSAGTATPWNASTNNTIDGTHNAYWTPAANANGTLNAFTAVAKDNGGLESATPIQARVAVAAVNDVPTLTAFGSAVANGNEDSQITVSFANLQSQGNEADVDGTVAAFVIKAVSSGSLKIGSSAGTATPWNASTNKTVDAAHKAYWTPAANANGALNAFRAVAKDNGGLESAAAIQARVAVTAVNDAPVLTTPTGINYTDTVFDDTFTTGSGLLTASDVDSSNLTYGIVGGIDNGLTISKSSAYGLLTVTKASGAYGFAPNDAAIEALTATANINFTVTASDGSLSSSKTLTINIAQSGITESIGNDTLTGTSANDRFDGLSGNDMINGMAGADAMKGGLGNDAYIVDNTGDVVTETSTLATEIDTVNSSITYTLGANLENLTLTGAAAINGTGNGLANTLIGNAGANSLTGGAGSDVLIGGLGKDTLTGGLNADQFKFNAEAETGITATTRDIIVDFSRSQGDKIDLSAIDANTAATGNNAFSAITVGGAFSGAFAVPGKLYFDQAAHVLYGNNDTDSAADFSIQLTAVSSLAAADLVL